MAISKISAAIVTSCVITLLLSSSTLKADDATGQATHTVPATTAQQGADNEKDVSVQPGARDAYSSSITDDPRPTPPGHQISALVRNMIEETRITRNHFLRQQRELRRSLPEPSKEAREELRNQLRIQREEFLNNQREARQEFRNALSDLKDQLKDHKEVLEQAREKEKLRVRRGE
jgi:hypothetical protein